MLFSESMYCVVFQPADRSVSLSSDSQCAIGPTLSFYVA